MTGVAEIRTLLPHRFPILLVDRVIELVPGEKIVAIKAVTCNEPWYAGLADTDDHRYPDTLIVESFMQAAGLLVKLGIEMDVPDGHVPIAGKLSGLEFHRRAVPGDVLTHEIRLVKRTSDTIIVAGECTVDGEVVVSFSRVMLAFRPGDVLAV